MMCAGSRSHYNALTKKEDLNMATINLDQMTTETRNEKTMQLDTMSVHD